jgi:type I restriction enzyme M protein
MVADTKRHIDNARQILVGVVPNPISQIDQITYALIYKFMDDMDQSALKEGGEASFFTGDLERYSWSQLLSPRIGNQERLNLYSEAFNRFAHASQIPELFREILKNANLPYRSPEVLGLFLKEIEYFDYSHPEELGNAYEYLLSIMGSQGDAGQFRTPRHLIDFIVDVVQPTEKDRILDPACGTGGFLVKAYQHILAQHSGEKRLTPSQKQELMDQIEGYDIDPGMVRIAQVNMFLHQFKNPKIYQYDTLSMEERWREKYDVIMANPPFMSPKGGIKPHNKFSVKSTRSEVLFVDYIMNHLKPKGRAGIIVPEGIIFQSGTAYKQLRKNLLQDGLYGVVSLPSGIFQPYSGVKTSVLLFDNELARQSKELLFVKVEADGFDLGAQRRPNNKNDLPKALEAIRQWQQGEKVEHPLALYVEKSQIAENGDYNLSGDRYRVATDYSNAKWPMVRIGDLCDLTNGRAFKPEDWEKKRRWRATNY